VSALPEKFWAALPLGRDVTLLECDANGVAALYKPAGVLSHPNEDGGESRAVLTARYEIEQEVFQWGPTGEASSRLWLLNRLDSATSGVILVAADGGVAREIRAQFKRRQVRKIYYALVFGAARQRTERWKDILAVDKRAGKIRTAANAGHIPAESTMTVVQLGKQEPPLTLLRLEPHTGRSHQLRVQCAKRGLPIVGDQTYGDFRRNRAFAKLAGEKRLFLHSAETVFEYSWQGKNWTFSASAPLPDEFKKFL
jgi:23S rRNA-/tRNA-specific pseudouridylate synthase